MWMRTRVAQFVVCCCLVTWMPGLLVAEPEDEEPLSQRELRLQTHLETLDQTLQHHRATLERLAAGGDGLQAEAQAERFLQHLRFLEGQVRSWSLPRADHWLHKLGSLRQLATSGEVRQPAVTHKITGVRKAAPANDACADALPIGNGSFVGDTSMASNDGEACGFSNQSNDVWFRYSTPVSGPIFANTVGSGFDTVLSVHEGCPGTEANQIECNDNAVGLDSSLNFLAEAGVEYYVRVAGFGDAAGTYALAIGPGGAISGRVTDAATGQPIPFVEVSTILQDGFSVRSATTEVSGNYTIGNLGTGTVKVYINDAANYRPEVYDNLPCIDFCDYGSGVDVEVQQGAVTTGIDFALDLGGTLSGTVTDAATGEPIESAEVVILKGDGNPAGYHFTGSDGRYAAGGLAAGSYRAYVLAQAYRDELYDNVPCTFGPPLGCPSDAGVELTVTLGDTTSGIDFALDRLGSISGQIVARDSGEPLPFSQVSVWENDGTRISSVQADENGVYRAGGLLAGTYFVTSRNGQGFQDEIYDDIPCPFGAPFGCDATIGSPIEVSLNNDTSGINFALERLGAITGTVTDVTTGEPIPFAEISVYDAAERFIESTVADASGFYRVDRLPTGPNFVFVYDFAYARELYDNIPCRRGCTISSGTPVMVPVDTTVPNIDFALQRLGSIAGTVTDASTGEPIPSISMLANSDGLDGFGAQTDSEGRYQIVGLDAGDFVVYAQSFDFLGELYDNIPCDDFDCDPMTGSRVSVSLEATTTGIDFALDRLGSISGHVTLAGGGDPSFASVLIEDAAGNFFGSDSVDAEGNYTVPQIPPGTYFAVATHSAFVGQLYDSIRCPNGSCDLSTGTPIVVEAAADTGGINFVLAPHGFITGQVTDAETGLPLAADIRVYDTGGVLVGFGVSSGDTGRYVVDNLSTGTYFARTGNIGAYARELYDDRPCTESSCDPTTGTPIEVVSGEATECIYFELSPMPFGAISGRLTDAFTGLPISSANVLLWDATGDLERSYGVDNQGRYALGQLEPGTYYLTTSTFSEYRDELYDGLPCPTSPPAGCDLTSGTPLAVTAEAILMSIDFELVRSSACTSSETTLCLANSRFQVEALWQDQAMNRDLGQSVRLTGDTGYFWFFDDSNVELVVKVLDACIDPFDRFWVFAGGLTDVAVELKVTDTLTGDVKIYNNQLGDAFQPVLDTDAFATCSATRPAETAGDHAVNGLDPHAAVLPFLPHPKTLALNDGRFTVDAVWTTAAGESETADSVTLTDDTGYFWFFDADNVEVVVKVLDACELPGFNSYWVFAAGLTDVEVAVTVTDTVSGEAKVYFNQLGSPFQPIQDTAAFDTCNAIRP